MKPAALILWSLGLVLTIVWLGADVRSDLSGLSSASPETLITPDVDLDLIVAVKGDTISQSRQVAKSLADILLQDERVAHVNIGPQAPSERFLEWLWDKRFQIVPPPPEAFLPENMTQRLAEAMAVFDSAEGIAIGDRLLLDPTGSYSEVLSRFEAQNRMLPIEDGTWQSRNKQASMIFVTHADTPFDARKTRALAKEIVTLAADQGARAVLLGTRVIAAETADANSRASAVASSVAAGLIVLWLVFAVRSVLMVLIFIPMAIGLGTGLCVVLAVFGFVHVIALGFGGALIGLSLDYPMHIICHPELQRQRVIRLVLLGAATTSLAFLAMLGSGIPALVQTGVFIASGMMASAISSAFLKLPEVKRLHVFPLSRFFWHLPGKPIIETAIILIGCGYLFLQSGPAEVLLFAPPDHVERDIKEMREFLLLPSGRYAVDVSAENLNELLAAEAALKPILDAAVKQGHLQGYDMLAELLEPQTGGLPDSATYRDAVEQALKASGLSTEFSAFQVEAFLEAQNADRISHEELTEHAETHHLTRRVLHTEEGWREIIPLYLPVNGVRPSFDTCGMDAVLMDRLEPIRKAITNLQVQLALWLLVGFLIATLLLAKGLNCWLSALRIMRTAIATLAISAAVLVAVYGSISIFHMVALALVLGIGVDYNLFFQAMCDDDEMDSTSSAVSLCATSTLIAFTVMFFSDVRILQQIGATVILGLSAMLILTLARKEKGTGGDSRDLV